MKYASIVLVAAALESIGVDSVDNEEVAVFKAIAKLIWADASGDMTFDFFGDSATCSWKTEDECVQHPTFLGGSDEAYEACETSMINALEDPRLNDNVEKYLLFNSKPNIPMSNCTSLLEASQEVFPESVVLDEARSNYLNGLVEPVEADDATLSLTSSTVAAEEVEEESTSMSLSMAEENETTTTTEGATTTTESASTTTEGTTTTPKPTTSAVETTSSAVEITTAAEEIASDDVTEGESDDVPESIAAIFSTGYLFAGVALFLSLWL
jgi:hypothetical protein